jgi:hypothetical protein
MIIYNIVGRGLAPAEAELTATGKIAEEQLLTSGRNGGSKPPPYIDGRGLCF